MGECGNPSEEQAKIVALTTKIDVLKKELSNKKNTDKKKKENSKGTDKKDSKWGWKKPKPTGDQCSKEVNGKTYYCKWVMHKPEECKNKPETNKETSQATNQTTTSEDTSIMLTQTVISPPLTPQIVTPTDGQARLNCLGSG